MIARSISTWLLLILHFAIYTYVGSKSAHAGGDAFDFESRFRYCCSIAVTQSAGSTSSEDSGVLECVSNKLASSYPLDTIDNLSKSSLFLSSSVVATVKDCSYSDESPIHVNTRTQQRSDTLVLTTYSSAIISFAEFSALVNARFAAVHGYDFLIFNASACNNKYDYAPEDRRWNKIKLIADGFETFAKKYKTLIFLDADLLVLDASLNITSIISEHLHGYPPQKISSSSSSSSSNIVDDSTTVVDNTVEVFLCQDTLDVANSGFMIIRNRPWAQSFFNRWWQMKGTRNTFCDQHVLNKLLNILKDENQFHKLAILPSRTFNSKWPVGETMETADPVLHLLGETYTARNSITKYAAQHMCRYLESHNNNNNNDDMMCSNGDYFCAHQPKASMLLNSSGFNSKILFGLNRQVIQELTRQALIDDFNSLLSRLSNPGVGKRIGNKENELNENIQKIHEVIVNLCSAKSHVDLSPPTHDCEKMYQAVITLIDKRTPFCDNNKSDKNSEEDEIETNPDSSDNDSPNLEFLVDQSRKAAGIGTLGKFGDSTTSITSKKRQTRSECLIPLLDQRAKFMYDKFYFVTAHYKAAAAKEVAASLKTLADVLDMSLPVNVHYIQHKKGILLGAMASFSRNQGDWVSSRRYAEMAVNTMSVLLNGMSQDDADFSGFAVEYIDTVSKLGHTLLSLGDLSSALEMAETALQNGIAHFGRISSDERIITSELSRLHLDVASVASDINSYSNEIYHNQHLMNDKVMHHVNAVDVIYRDFRLEIPSHILTRLRSILGGASGTRSSN